MVLSEQLNEVGGVGGTGTTVTLVYNVLVTAATTTAVTTTVGGTTARRGGRRHRHTLPGPGRRVHVGIETVALEVADCLHDRLEVAPRDRRVTARCRC